MNALDSTDTLADARERMDAELRRQERAAAKFLDQRLAQGVGAARARSHRIVRVPVEVFEDAEELLVG